MTELPAADSPVVSVLTTGAGNGDLAESQASLMMQRFQNWEWVVVLDRNDWRPVPDDRRLRIVLDDVGSVPLPAMALARSVALGEILVELERGNRLAPDALQRLLDE
jgi:hypothetical protein